MSTTVKAGWLKDNQGNKFAPKTMSSQIINDDGILLEDNINLKLTELKQYTDEELTKKANSEHSHDEYVTTAYANEKLALKSDIENIELSGYETKEDAQVKYDTITTSKVNVSDIVNNLETDVSNQPLSAAQGVVISNLIEEINNEIDVLNEKIKSSETLDCISLKDKINGYTYTLEMRNGQLCSVCACSSIMVSAFPDKTEYEQGEEFDPTGMIISVVCEDGSTREITNYTCSDIVDGIVTITYIEDGTEYTTNISIIVKTVEDLLIDFEYTKNDDTYTLNSWKGTLNGEPSTEMVFPDSDKIIM